MQGSLTLGRDGAGDFPARQECPNLHHRAGRDEASHPSAKVSLLRKVKRQRMARSSRRAFPKGDLRGFSDAWRAYPAKTSSFRMHGARILPRTGDFPVRDHFWDAWSAKLATDCRPGTHFASILPSASARERTAAESCRGKALGNASREYIATASRAKSALGRNPTTVGRWGTHLTSISPSSSA